MSATSQRLVSAVAIPTTLTGWALLSVDGLMLALPQKDIVTIELTEALQPAPESTPDGNAMDGDNAIGWLKQGAQHWPVYCLDRHLAVLSALIAAAPVCVLFRSDERILGLAVTRVSMLANDADIVVSPLPACLKQPGSPLIGLTLRDNTIVAVVHAQALSRYLSSPETSLNAG